MKTLLFSFILIFSCNVFAQKENSKQAIFKDSLDQAVDISDWLLTKKGVLVVPTIITEPALGFGLAGGAIYFHNSYTAKNGPPSMTGVLGGGTQNGTWMAGVFHAGFWKHDHIRYLGAVARTSANFAFYGSGDLGLTDQLSVNLNLDAWVTIQQMKFRISSSDFFLGFKYIYLNTDNTFSAEIQQPGFDGSQFSSVLSEVSLVTNYDSRNNIFTPSRGFYIECTGTYSDTWLGSDDLYGRLSTTLIGYAPLSKKIVMGIRQEDKFTYGAVPFYARPYVSMRGVPLMKYQDNNTILLETEFNYNVYRRWSLVGFTGMGNAFEDFSSYDKGKSVVSVGTGFRYLLARKLGAQMGMDFAKSNDDFAFYFVFGTSWLR